MFPVSSRWDPTRGSSWPASKVQVWSMSQLVAETRDYVTGKVTEKRANGKRSFFNLTVPANDRWRHWLSLPGLELLPFSGYRWGTYEELVPLGVFPVLPSLVPGDVATVSVYGEDHWQYVQSGDFVKARSAYPGRIRDVMGQLLLELGIGAGRLHPLTKDLVGKPNVTATSTATTNTSVVWEHRHEALMDYADDINSETFVDRYGRPQVVDRVNTPGADLSDGRWGTVVSLDSSVDWSEVVNMVTVSNSNANTPYFDQIELGITNPGHPAHSSKIGPKILRVSTNTAYSRDMAVAMATGLLDRRSSPALGWTATCLPDPSREPGDEFYVTYDGDKVKVVANQVVHPLVEGNQVVQLGAV